MKIKQKSGQEVKIMYNSNDMDQYTSYWLLLYEGDIMLLPLSSLIFGYSTIGLFPFSVVIVRVSWNLVHES